MLAHCDRDLSFGVLLERGLDGGMQGIAPSAYVGCIERERERILAGHLIETDGDRLGVPRERDTRSGTEKTAIRFLGRDTMRVPHACSHHCELMGYI